MRRPSLRLVLLVVLVLPLLGASAQARPFLSAAAGATWASTYDWAGGDGTAGWSAAASAGAGEYGMQSALGGNAGLWLWPSGGRYGPGDAEWTFTAPGTTTIESASLDLVYRNKLLAHHCIELGLRNASGVVASNVRCDPTGAPDNPSRAHVVLSDPAASATQAFFRISVDCNGAASCSKNIPSLDPLTNGAYARLTAASFVLDDVDTPTVVASGPFVDLGGTYIDGRSSYGLTVSAADGGSGVASASVTPGLVSANAPCDRTHSTPALGAAICPATFTFSRTIDTTQLPEGTNAFGTSVTDYAGNTGTGNSWSFAIDRTAPDLASGFSLGTYDDSYDLQTVSWSAGADPALPDGTPGSGVAKTEVRYGYDGGALGDWQAVDGTSFTAANAFPTHTLDVEVRETDAVGNASTASASLAIPVPEYAVGKPWLLPQCHSDGDTPPPDFCSQVGETTDDAANAPDTCDGSVPGLCESTAADVQAAGLDPSAFDSLNQSFLAGVDSPTVVRQLLVRSLKTAEKHPPTVRRLASGTVVVPNVIGMSANDAFNTLLNAGLLSVDYLRATPDSVVVDQEFCGGYDSGIPFGGELGLNVGLYFSTDTYPDPYSCASSGGGGGGGGGGPALVAVPDVSGMTVADAQRTLQGVGLSSTVTWDKATPSTPVFATDPDPGTMVVPNQNIKLNFVHGPTAGVELYAFLVFELVRTGVKPGGANPCASAPVVDSGHCGFLWHLSTPVRTRDHVVVGPTFYTVFNARAGGGNGVYGNDPSHQWVKDNGPIPAAWGSSAGPTGERVHHWGWAYGHEVGFTAVPQSSVSYYPGFWELDPQQIWEGANHTGTERDGLLIHGGWQGHQLNQLGTNGCIRIMYTEMPRLEGLWAHWTDNRGVYPGPALYAEYEP
jgi:hypothetical protein